jgi:nicotinamidase-related amidase
MKTALLIVDVINHFEFPDGPRLLAQSIPVAPRIARLKARARNAKLPVIYVNDNFGQWRSDAAKLLQYCLRPAAPGRVFVSQIRPGPQDYFVLKPMHSAFYQSPLEALLRSLGVKSLVLCGIATNSCIVCTAHDADMREFNLYVPSDCCAARTRREHQQSISHIKTLSHARVLRSSALNFGGPL